MKHVKMCLVSLTNDEDPYQSSHVRMVIRFSCHSYKVIFLKCTERLYLLRMHKKTDLIS